MTKWLAVLLLTILASNQAYAGFEIRGHYSPWSKPNKFNSAMSGMLSGYPALGAPQVLGADALYVLPILPIVVGLRYESISMKGDGPVTISGVPLTAKTKFSGSRTSLIGGMRLLNTFVYLGALAHLGVSQTAKYSNEFVLSGSGTVTNYKGKVDPSYGVSLEGGVKLSSFLIGAELGYTVFKVKSFTDDSGSKIYDSGGNEVAMDLSGPFARVLLGLAF